MFYNVHFIVHCTMYNVHHYICSPMYACMYVMYFTGLSVIFYTVKCVLSGHLIGHTLLHRDDNKSVNYVSYVLVYA